MSKTWILPIVGLLALIAGVPFGEIGGTATFIFLAVLAIYYCVFRLKGVYYLGAGAFVFFALNHTFRFLRMGLLEELSAIAGYILIAAFAAHFYKNRSTRTELVAVLEAGSVALVAGLGVIVSQHFIGSSPTQIFTLFVIIVVAVFASASILGRTSSKVGRALTAGIASVAVLQLFDGQLPDELWSTLWSIPVIPVLYLLGLPASDRETQASSVGARRRFGIVQQALFTFLQGLAYSAVAMLAVVQNRELLLIAAPLALIFVGLVAYRFHLLIKQRDWSYDQEQGLRSYGEEIIQSTTVDDLDVQTTSVLDQLTNNNAATAILEAEEGSFEVSASGSITPNFKNSRFKPIRLGEEQTPVEAWFTNYQNAKTTIAVPVPNATSESQTWFVAALPGYTEADTEEHFKAAATQYGMSQRAQQLTDEIQEQKANQRYNTLSQDANDLVMVVDKESKEVTFIGENVERLIGGNRGRYINSHVLDLIHGQDKSIAEQELNEPPVAGEERTADVRLRMASGETRWFEMSVRNAEESGISGLLVNFSDIHDRKLAALNVRNSEARFRAMVQHSADVSILADADLDIEYVSPNISSMFGQETEDLVGTSLFGFISEDSHGLLETMFERSSENESTVEEEVMVRGSLGTEERLCEVSVSPSNLDGQDSYVILVRDITARRELEDDLRNKALYDELTGLLNRSAFIYETQTALQELDNQSHTCLATINLKNFKELNDSVGFATGDEVLTTVAGRLRATLRGDDKLARLSADEFAVVSNVATIAEAEIVAQRLKDSFNESCVVDGKDLRIEASIGYTTTQDRRKNADSLLQQATVAMHKAKAEKNSAVVHFTKQMLEETAERFELQGEMQTALDNDDFYLVYQPLINLDDNSVRGFEALMRWDHPERGGISPGVFIPLAEQSGLIVEMGRWVLRHACSRLKHWQTEYAGFAPVTMSVNLSARQLEDRAEMDRLLAIVDETGVDPSNLVLELTETAMVEDAASIGAQLEHIRSLGIKIAIDDFGAGNQGLGNLKDLPFDSVKLDKKYIDDIVEEEARTLVESILGLSQSMGAYAVAEGIETPEQIDVLTELGCDVGQGFYLARPMPELKLLNWMVERQLGNLLAH